MANVFKGNFPRPLSRDVIFPRYQTQNKSLHHWEPQSAKKTPENKQTEIKFSPNRKAIFRTGPRNRLQIIWFPNSPNTTGRSTDDPDASKPEPRDTTVFLRSFATPLKVLWIPFTITVRRGARKLAIRPRIKAMPFTLSRRIHVIFLFVDDIVLWGFHTFFNKFSVRTRRNWRNPLAARMPRGTRTGYFRFENIRANCRKNRFRFQASGSFQAVCRKIPENLSGEKFSNLFSCCSEEGLIDKSNYCISKFVKKYKM